MIERSLKGEVEEWLSQFPCVGILGARQVGKTTLAKTLMDQNSIYIDLESDLGLGQLSQPGLFLRQNTNKRIIIDEIQRMPELFPLLRSIIDEDRKPGRFILLGSASPKLLRDSSESLAGRIAYLELPGFMLSEVQESDFIQLWVRGGFPQSFLATNDAQSFRWRKQLLQAYVERDLPLLGIGGSHLILSRLLYMLAGTTGQIFNASTLARSLGVSPPSIKKYVDFLQDAYLLYQLQPYYINIRKRLVKSSKIYFRDTGLLHSLLRIENYNQLLGHVSLGASWENFAIGQIKSVLRDHFELYFYRTQDGTEADLVLASGDKPLYMLEFKFSNKPNPTRGTFNAIADLKTSRNFIVCPETSRYPVTEKLEVISLPDFLTHLQGEIS